MDHRPATARESSASASVDRPHRRRRKALLPLFALSCLLPAALHAEGKGIRFWNLTSTTIKQLYLSPAGRDAFGPDQIVNDPDGALDHDERLKLIGITPGRYDLKLADTTGRICFARNLAIEANSVVSVQDKDLSDCSK